MSFSIDSCEEIVDGVAITVRLGSSGCRGPSIRRAVTLLGDCERTEEMRNVRWSCCNIPPSCKRTTTIPGW